MDSGGESSDKKEDGGVQKKELPASLQKICLVCGDKALGYNFNAISCESCKAFFRRNALASKEFKCPFTNNCEITIVTRRFCQKCRLEKCLAIGMVKEFIMSDEDKAEKRRKIEENRAKKRQHPSPEDTVTSSKLAKPDKDASSSYLSPTESIVQYDVLNSTTCSPSSTTVQSPLSNELESIHSPPMYYPSGGVQPNNQFMKVYPIDEKSVINRAVYDSRSQEETYNMYDTLESNSNMYEDSPKENSIRYLYF
jgi:hypothetical protein